MNKFLSAINTFRVKHEPEILMSMGIAGLTFSTIWGINATVKAVKKCQERCKAEGKDKLTVREIIQTTWMLYIPVVIPMAASIPCIIAGNRVSSKRNAALAAAYTISETALEEYKAKTKEIVGEKKEEEIRKKVADESVKKIENSKEIVVVGEGEQLFIDSLSGRLFKSSWNELQKACNEMNEQALLNMSGSYTVNEWYDRIGLDRVADGDLRGWQTSAFDCTSGLLRISMTTTKTKDDKPVGQLEYDVMPKMFK